jgi:hypothetical protein
VVSYTGGYAAGYASSGVMAHLFDVTALVGTEGTALEQQRRHQALEMAVRRALHDQGYGLPFDHEKEDWQGSQFPAWRARRTCTAGPCTTDESPSPE